MKIIKGIIGFAIILALIAFIVILVTFEMILSFITSLLFCLVLVIAIGWICDFIKKE